MEKRVSGEPYTWTGIDAAAGAIGVGAGKAVGAAARVVEYNIIVPRGTAAAAEGVSSSVATGAAKGTISRSTSPTTR